MALRVARGLFRLWLVLSMVWVAGVGVHTWRTFPSYEPYVYDSDTFLGELRGDIAPRFPAREEPAVVAVVKRHAVIQSVIRAVVPPFFVLALGSALVWAFRGFR
jgi:hypothetical protein